MSESNKVFFYKGLPYTNPIETKDGYVYGYCLWNKSDVIKVNKEEVEYCEPKDIESKFLENCREAITGYLVGWNKEKAIELENQGREYLMKTITAYVNLCPFSLYEACRKGKYGYVIPLSLIELPETLCINRRMCSDEKYRENKDVYVRYLLGENFNLLNMFIGKYPYLEFMYYKYDKNLIFQDIICLVPFHTEMEKINDSVIL